MFNVNISISEIFRLTSITTVDICQIIFSFVTKKQYLIAYGVLSLNLEIEN